MVRYASTIVVEIACPQPVSAGRTQPQNSAEERVSEYGCDEANNLLNCLELFYLESLIGTESSLVMLNTHSKILLSLLFFLSTSQFLSAQSSLAERLRQDEALQDAAIIVVRSALGAQKQTVVVRRNTFAIEIGMYIQTYRTTRNTNTLENIQKRYTLAKSELLEPRLPATIEELVSILEIL